MRTELMPTERKLREIYQAGNQSAFSETATVEKLKTESCYEAVLGVLDYGLSEKGIEQYFEKIIAQHADWNVYVFLHPRYFPALAHSHPYTKAICIRSGTCHCSIHGKLWLLEAGDICFISPDTVHSIGAFSDDAIALNLVMRRSIVEDCFSTFLSRADILCSFFSNIFFNANCGQALIFHTGYDARIQQLLTLMDEETYAQTDAYTPYMNEAYLLQLLGLILRHHGDDVTILDLKRHRADPNILACLRYLDEHYIDVTLNDLSRRFHYAPSTLSRLIKSCLGRSFMDYVRECKLKKAAALIVGNDMPFSQIGNECGFTDTANFYRAFRKFYGKTPAEYRKDPSTGQTQH